MQLVKLVLRILQSTWPSADSIVLTVVIIIVWGGSQAVLRGPGILRYSLPAWPGVQCRDKECGAPDFLQCWVLSAYVLAMCLGISVLTLRSTFGVGRKLSSETLYYHPNLPLFLLLLLLFTTSSSFTPPNSSFFSRQN